MTVKQLKEALEHCNDDAIVYLSNPDFYGSDFQKAHEEVGARLIISANEEVFFWSYNDEEIDEELDAMVQVAEEENWSDNDFIDELFYDHGYTLEDIYKANKDIYKFCIYSEYGRDMYYEYANEWFDEDNFIKPEYQIEAETNGHEYSELSV